MAFRMNYGMVLVFIAFGIMFVGLINKSSSDMSKALVVIVCFILMAFGAFVGNENFKEKIEGTNENNSSGIQRNTSFG